MPYEQHTVNGRDIGKCRKCGNFSPVGQPCVGIFCVLAGNTAPIGPEAWNGTDPAPTPAPAHKGLESALQHDCEAWLRHRGYWPRTPKCILCGQKPERGWYIHLHDCEDNPILLDLLILSNGGRALELELKSASGRTSKEQAALLAAYEAQPIRSIEEFRFTVMAWEPEELS